jgi:hypothetical protein
VNILDDPGRQGVLNLHDGKPRDPLFEAMAELAYRAGYAGAGAGYIGVGPRAMAICRNHDTAESIEVTADTKPHAYALMSRLLAGLIGPVKDDARERAQRIAAGQCSVLAGWCLTHNVEENASHAFDTGNLATLD